MKLYWPIQSADAISLVTNLAQKSLFSPFDEHVLLFFQQVSQHLMKGVNHRQYPELVALAYWLRKGNITRLKLEYQLMRQDRIIRPRGTVLHYAPSNVDTIFVYSWALSLLAGNKSVIRLSRKADRKSVV